MQAVPSTASLRTGSSSVKQRNSSSSCLVWPLRQTRRGGSDNPRQRRQRITLPTRPPVSPDIERPAIGHPQGAEGLLLSERVFELGQFRIVQVRNGPERHLATTP